jgi:hypothetical protein
MTVSESLSRKVSVIQTSLAPRVGGTFGDLEGHLRQGVVKSTPNLRKSHLSDLQSFKLQTLVLVFYIVLFWYDLHELTCKNAEKINIVPKKKPNFNIIQLWKLKAMVSQSPLSLPTNMQTGKANAVMGAGSKAPGVAPIITGSATK